MGRGRAKAKQQKKARELKYSTPVTDLSALERELHGTTNRNGPHADEADTPDAFEDDDYDEWAPRTD